MKSSAQHAWVLMGLLLAVIAAAGGVQGCRRAGGAVEAGRPAAAPVEVQLGPVVRTPLERRIQLTGTLFGREEATLSAKVAGRVTEIVRDVDDVAKSGDVVVQVERTEYRLALAERESALKAALAKLGLKEMPGEDFDASKVPTVVRSRAEAANAAAKMERARSLYEQKPPLLSQQDFDDIRTQSEVSMRSAEVERLNAEATLAEAKTQAAVIASAQQKLDDTAIRAPTPMSGESITYRVAERLVSLGEIVSVGQAVARIVASDVLKFRGQVPEQYMGRVVQGQKATVKVDAFAESFAGVVARVAPRIDSRTRTFEVEIEIANPQGRLKPGGFARVAVVIGVEENIPQVPKEAVVSFAGVRRIFSVKDGKAVAHVVQTGEERDGMVEVLGAFDVQEVVVGGAEGLTQGAGVAVNKGK